MGKDINGIKYDEYVIKILIHYLITLI